MLRSDIEALYASGNGHGIDRSAFMGFKGGRQSIHTSFIRTDGDSENDDVMIYIGMFLSSLQMQTDVIRQLFFLIHLLKFKLLTEFETHSHKHSLIHFKAPTFKSCYSSHNFLSSIV